MAPVATSDDDPTFAVLPARQRQRIDRAFDIALKGEDDHSAEPSRKRRKLDPLESADPSVGPGGFLAEEPVVGGGFLVEDEDVAKPHGGGFIVDEEDGHSEEESSTNLKHLPMNLIPKALQLLDLQPDDEDVLEVFRNAASGWENPVNDRIHHEDTADGHLLVSRRDWRAVCAALLDDGPDENNSEDDLEEPTGEDRVQESDASSEEYIGSGSDIQSVEDSDDEYEEGGFIQPRSRTKRSSKTIQTSPPRKSRRKKGSSPLLSGSDSETDSFQAKGITPRQKAECRRTFALFFPDVADEDLESRRIMIRDVTRVAALLKEKLTVEEVVEMLEAFSTSPDKSMSLPDFERMMVTAKMA